VPSGTQGVLVLLAWDVAFYRQLKKNQNMSDRLAEGTEWPTVNQMEPQTGQPSSTFRTLLLRPLPRSDYE
jgi:hypothetical protein